ncbi:unnamed protein product [Menidia menidia]|uniref:(Atlantic silverside) hypothetical protein n=1 Tax=Menidia menidia TaxID=238744 RepID=A0A8S4B452_9TELE|nr:unnamed protein product [Menidia menidia]
MLSGGRKRLGTAVVAKYGVELLGDPDESGPAAQLLQLAGAHVGAGGADPPQDVPDGLGAASHLVQSQGHLKGPHSVHVGGDDGDPPVAALGVPESEAPHQVHLQGERKYKP